MPANPVGSLRHPGGSAQFRVQLRQEFDPVAAVTNALNDIGAGVDNMMNAMTAAAPVPLPRCRP